MRGQRYPLNLLLTFFIFYYSLYDHTIYAPKQQIKLRAANIKLFKNTYILDRSF